VPAAVNRIDFETDDRDAAADAIEGAFGFRAQLRGRRIGFRQQTLEGSDVSFTELRFGADLRTDVDPNPSFVVAEIPRGRYEIRVGRQNSDLSHGGLFLLPMGSPMRVELDHTVTRTYNLGPVENLRRFALQTAPDASALDLTRLRPVSDVAERYLRDTLGLYRRHFLTDTSPVPGLAADEAYRHLLATAVSVFGLLAPQEGGVLESTVVRRMRAHIAEHLLEPLTVNDLAAASGTGVRSLQLACRRELGVSPMELVREARLVAARAELLESSGGEQGERIRVTAVAERWGFLNAGRFSGAYFRRYGEYPSDTLRRL
jgi:AraC-like DNA-binding protein